MSVIELIKRNTINYVVVKIAVSILGVALCIPLTSLLYWSFDSAYLAAFGVGPEIFSRPVFSSKLMLTWSVLGALKPAFWVVGAVSLTLFSILFYGNYKLRMNILSKTENDTNQSKKPETKLQKTFDIIDESAKPAIALFMIFLFLIIFILVGMREMSKNAEELAAKQVEDYLVHNICHDTFNDNIDGCYSITDEPDNNYLVITNNDKLIIFLSRVVESDEITIFVAVKDKSSNKKVVREYKRETLAKIEARATRQKN